MLARLSPYRLKPTVIELGGGESFDYYISTTGSDSNDGSEGSPWAITALMSKSAEIAGKRVGLKDGTYTVPNGYDDNWGGGPKNHGQRITAAGSSGARTVIEAVNTGGAILNPGAGVDFSIITIDADYVTMKWLVFDEFDSAQIRLWADNVRIDTCDFRAITNDVSNDNLGHIYFEAAGQTTVKNPYITNCRFRGVYNDTGPSSGSNAIAIFGFSVEGMVIEYCTFTNCYAPAVAKHDWLDYTIRYCHGYDISNGIMYVATNTAGRSYRPQIHNNLFICDFHGSYNYQDDGSHEAASFDGYNNTLIMTGAQSDNRAGRMWRYPHDVATTSEWFNNIVHYVNGVSGTPTHWVIGGNTGCTVADQFSVFDYNLYSHSARFTVGDLWSPDTTYADLAAWQSGEGMDEHAEVGVPTFVGSTPSNPAHWALQGGSVGKSSGSTDGTTGGAACEKGCYGGPNPPAGAQIGATIAA